MSIQTRTASRYVPASPTLVGYRKVPTVSLHDLYRWLKVRQPFTAFVRSCGQRVPLKYETDWASWDDVEIEGQMCPDKRLTLPAACRLLATIGGNRATIMRLHLGKLERQAADVPAPVPVTGTASVTAAPMNDLGLQVADGGVYADSRRVAEVFGRLHKNVLAAIRDLDCSADFRRLNFQPFEINDLTGTSTSHVTMTRNGFAFLAMGFTGAKAAEFKELYITRFDAMEAELRRRDGGVAASTRAGLKALFLETLAERDGALLPRLIESALASDPRVAVREFKAPLQILQEAGVPPRGRRPLSCRVSARLRRYCIATGRGAAIRESAETGRHLYQVDVVQAWLDAEGNRLIAAHKTAVLGQGVIPFGPKPL